MLCIAFFLGYRDYRGYIGLWTLLDSACLLPGRIKWPPHLGKSPCAVPLPRLKKQVSPFPGITTSRQNKAYVPSHATLPPPPTLSPSRRRTPLGGGKALVQQDTQISGKNCKKTTRIPCNSLSPIRQKLQNFFCNFLSQIRHPEKHPYQVRQKHDPVPKSFEFVTLPCTPPRDVVAKTLPAPHMFAT